MLNAKEISDKIAEYKSLLWLKKRYSDTSFGSGAASNDLIPTVFHQAGSYGINRTDSKDVIETLIKSTAVRAIDSQITVLEGEFKRMKISLEGIEA
jgi:hypothetical protein